MADTTTVTERQTSNAESLMLNDDVTAISLRFGVRFEVYNRG